MTNSKEHKIAKCLGIWLLMFVLSAVLAALISVIINLLAGKVYANMTSLYAYIMFLLVSVAYCVFLESRSLESMGFVPQCWAKKFAKGAAIGVGVCFILILMLLLSGNVEITRNHEFNFLLMLGWIGGYMIQGFSEEVIFCGYLMQSLRRVGTTGIAILFSSLFFALAHVFNAGMNWLALFNTFLIGLFMALLMALYNNIWLVGGFHAFYNIAQVNLLEISLTGHSLSKASFMLVTPSASANIFGLNDYGLVGSRVTTLAFIILIIILTFRYLRSNNHRGQVAAGGTALLNNNLIDEANTERASDLNYDPSDNSSDNIMSAIKSNEIINTDSHAAETKQSSENPTKSNKKITIKRRRR